MDRTLLLAVRLRDPRLRSPPWGLSPRGEAVTGLGSLGVPGGPRLAPWPRFPPLPSPGRASAPGSYRSRYYYFVIYSLIYSFIKCLLSSVQM